MKDAFLVSVIWWVIGILFAVLLVLPMGVGLLGETFIWTNMLIGWLFFSLIRSLLQFKNTMMAKSVFFRLIIFILLFPLIFWVIQSVLGLQYEWDYGNLQALVEQKYSASKASFVQEYLLKQYRFVGVGVAVLSAILIIKMVLYTWANFAAQRSGS